MAELQSSQVSQLELAGVHALSCPGKAVLAACPTAEHLVASAANSFVVVWDVGSGQQVKQLRSITSNNPLQCVAWSCCGTHIAAGEAGSSAAVQIFHTGSGQCVQELKGHKHTVCKLSFSPDGKLLASAGSGLDGHLCIWDWHTGTLLCKQKVATDLGSVAFTEDSSHVLAVGKGTVKSWSLTWTSPRPTRSRSSSSGGGSSDAPSSTLSLTARQVSLKQQRTSTFVDLCLAPSLAGQPTGSNGVYALTDKGTLLLLRSTGRTVDRSINLQVTEAFGLAAAPKLVACACSRGTVRLFSSKALSFKANLPYWSPEGNEVDSSSFADARGCTFGPGHLSESLLVVVYSNHEIVLWDVQNLAQIHPLRSVAAHTSHIWDVCTYNMPGIHSGLDPAPADMQGCATCAADGNIRFWGISQTSGELLSLRSVQAGSPPVAASVSKVQLRCMRISHDGQLLAAGDTAGNVHVYDMNTLQHIATQEAHDLEVLCLDFSPPPHQATAAHHKSLSSTGGKGLAVSGSRDMLIHVYDTCHGFRLLETLDEHEAEVTAVRFTCGGKGLVSCAGDHTIIFRALGTRGGLCSAYGYKVALKETLPQHLLYDLVVDPLDTFVLTADLNGILRQWDAASGRVLRTMQPEVGAGQVARLCMDPGGAIAICCHSDGCLRLYDIKTGLLKWRAWGHASAVAAAAVTSDLKQLVSVGADGCIMLWTLPRDLSQQLQDAAACLAAAQQQLGSPALLPLLRQHQHNSTDGVTCSPSASSAATATAAGVATPPPSSTVLFAHGASAASTPGSGDMALSSTARRIREGRPLVSADRLPRWAQSPAAQLAATQYQRSEDGAGKPHQEQQQQRRPSKWVAGHLASAAAAIDPSVKDDESQAARISSAHVGTNTAADVLLGEAQQQQQPVALPGHMHHGRLVIRHWSDGSIYNKEAAATASVAAPGGVPHEGKPESQPHEQLHQPPLLPAQVQTDTAHSSPATSGTVAVVRDLFKAHFSSPYQAGQGCKAEETATQDDCLVVQQDRQSFSSKFKKGRSSLSQICSSVHEQEIILAQSVQESAGQTASASCSPSPGTAEHHTGLTPQGSKLFREVSCTSPAAGARQQPPAVLAAPQIRPAALNTGVVGHDASCLDTPTPPAHSQEPSPRERRWRQGQMKPELAGMWERLENLQAEFVQQQQQQSRASPARPARPKSSLDHASPTRERPSLARRRSDNSAGCQTHAVAAVVAQAQGGQHRQPYQQGQSCLEQQPRLQSSYAATLSTNSPGRKHCNPLTAAAGGRATAVRQPSPHASGKPEWQGVKDRPPCSPQTTCENKQQPTPAKGTPAPEGRTTPVFGSRTLARSLQRRKSSAGGATGTAQVPDADAQPSSSTVAADGPAAAGLPQASSGNQALLAALLADDSPTPSPQASAVHAVQVHVNAEHNSINSEMVSSAVAKAASNPCTAAAAASATSHLNEPSEAAAAAHTPKVPNAAAELAELLAWDSSPESLVMSQSTAHLEQTTGALGSPSFGWHAPVPALKPGDETAAKQLQVNAALFDSMSSPGSACLPSLDCSPDKQQLLSPIAVPCSPQLNAACASSPGTRPQGGKASQHASSQRLRELSARMKASTECRVSIGTSIAARSPTAVATVHSSPAAVLLPGQHRLTNTAGSNADGAASEASIADQGECLRSVSFDPSPASGSAKRTVDTPKVDPTGAALASLTVYEQQQPPRLPAEVTALPDKAGVTITPNGGHEVWPGWGAGGAWEVTPSPIATAVPVKKMWGADVPGPGHAGAGISSHNTASMDGSTAALNTAAGAAETEEICLVAEHSTGSVAGEGQYEVPPCSNTYWVAQNPCYDMTPRGSAGRTRGQGNQAGVPGSVSFEPSPSSNAHTRLTGEAGIATQHTDPCSVVDAGALVPGPTSGAACARGNAAPSSYASAGDMFAQASGGFSRRTSFASISSASSVAATAEQQAPTTPASMGDSSMLSSEPSSAASSKAGTRRQGSGGKRGFSKTMQSVSGSRAAQSSPGSDGPGSPSSGMLALLQRMRWSLPSRKSRSSTSGGGCMTPRALEQQGSRDGRSGGTSADDILLEVTSAAMSSSCTAPVRDATGRCTHVTSSKGYSRPQATAAQVAATVDNFKHSIQEMKQLLQQLQGLQLDADSTSALHRILTPQRSPGDAAGAHSAGQLAVHPEVDDQQRHVAEVQQSSAGSRLSGPAQVVPLHQQLQQEVLTCISELHIAVTGMPLS